ncbi:hypothetical protein JG688_00000477 [Phytophthora aleatoria]|uniref:Uncharacterized protein n=1 Tax=Phytophthora aleatoria TaxID=2496075 RepID=A0A8J5J864_9STRA|nr:hypothetical protein JG688_00000477 [Phytophthora aleatoria]
MGFNGETDKVLLLTAVQFVTRECLHARGIELEHVSRAIDDYVNELPRDWSLEDAYKKTGSLRCMQYVAAREPEMLPISYQAWVANNIAEMTVRRGDVQALKWLAERGCTIVTTLEFIGVVMNGVKLFEEVTKTSSNGYISM